MKKIFTLFSICFAVFAQAQVATVVSIDSVWVTPANPAPGDSVFLHIEGVSNKPISAQSTPFIADTGRVHTFSLCYLAGDSIMADIISDSFGVYRANLVGTDTLEWYLFYNKNTQNFCDTSLAADTMLIHVNTTGVYSFVQPDIKLSWDLYTSSLRVEGLRARTSMQLLDVNARLLKVYTLERGTSELSFSGMVPGMYIVYLFDNEGMSYRQKVFFRDQY